MNKHFFCTLCFAVIFFAHCLSAESLAAPRNKAQKSRPSYTYTLEQAVQQALKANPSIQSKLDTLEQAKMNIGVAQSFFWPRVTLISTATRTKNFGEVSSNDGDSNNLASRNWSQGWRATMSLFAGFSHLNTFQKSRLQVDVEKARYKQACLELVTNVQIQFLNLLKFREDLKSAEKAVARINMQLKAAEAFVKVGMAPYLDVLQNKTDLARTEQQLIRAQNDIRNTEVQLNRFLGLPPEIKVNYVGNLKDYASTVGYSEEEAIKRALSQRPDLIVAQKTVEVAWKDMHINMGQFLPRVDVNYDNMSSSKDYDDSNYEGYTKKYWSAGITFSWEIFSGGNGIFQSLADRKRAQALAKDYEEAINGARTEVIRSLLDINAAKELIVTSQRGVEAAQENYDMANKRYLTNIGTITELVDSQLRLTAAEADASRALTEFQSARSRFFFYIGYSNPGLK